MQPTEEEQTIRSELWQLRTSYEYLDGDKEAHDKVKALEQTLAAKEAQHQPPGEYLQDRIEEFLERNKEPIDD